MNHLFQIDISQDKTYYVAADTRRSLLTRGKTLHELIENLEFAIEELMPDPDEGLELTAKAKQRLAVAKRMMEKGDYKSYTLEEIKKKYHL